MITVDSISKTFKLYSSPADRLKEIVLRKQYHRNFQALDNVSFHVGEGRTLGIIGSNGAGKSTLLKILTGVLMPDSGKVTIDGRITGLLELGTGFNEEFSGLDNIYLNGTLLGMSRPEISKRLDAIVAFAELGQFINEPMKTYSSGMSMRLAFSVAIHADPKAFVVDEALSVGDAYFQLKCMQRIKEFKDRGGAIVFVSHDMNAVKVLCDRAMLLEQGRMVEEGAPEEVINSYNYLMARRSRGEEVQFGPDEKTSYGNFKARIESVALCDGMGEQAAVFLSGRPCVIRVRVAARENVDNLSVGVLIRDRFGQDMYGTNTHLCGKSLPMQAGQALEVEFALDELNLGPGKYSLTVAAHREESHVHECYHWTDRATAFEVVTGEGAPFAGVVRLTPRLTIQPAADGDVPKDQPGD